MCNQLIETESESIDVQHSMSALAFLELYKGEYANPSYYRGAKSYISFCFQYMLPFNENTCETYALDKSPASKTFSKKCVKYMVSLGVHTLMNDLNVDNGDDLQAVKFFLSRYEGIDSDESRATYKNCLRKYIKYANQYTYPIFHHVTLSEFKKHLIKDGLQSSYINNLLSIIRSFASFIILRRDSIEGIGKEEVSMMKEMLLVKNVRRKKSNKHKESLSSSERTILLNSVEDSTNRLIISLMCNEALRRGEIPYIQHSDIDLYNGLIYVRGKGYRNEPVPVKLFSYSIDLLKKIPLNTSKEKLFGILKKESVSSLAKKSVSEAGIKANVTAHGLRHTALQILRENGAPIEFVQKQARHADIQTTLIYSQKSVDEIYFNEMKQYETKRPE